MPIAHADEAIKITVANAKYGDPQSQFKLGMAFLSKDSALEYNSVRAVYWLEEAALRGHIGAQINLGGFYYDGVIVFKSYETSFKWYKLAAEKGEPIAQLYLSELYNEGKGTDKDRTTAYAWLLTAEKNIKLKQVNRLKISKERLEKELLEAQKEQAEIISKKFIRINKKKL